MITLEAGKSYVTKRGEKVTINSILLSAVKFPAAGSFQRDGNRNPEQNFWTETGRFWTFSDSEHDIVAEWVDPLKVTPKEQSSVTHPAHYNSGKIEVIEAIEDWKLNFHRGNAVKYTARAGKKDPSKEIEDLEKAVWYLQREIENLKAAKEGRAAVRPNDMNPRGAQ